MNNNSAALRRLSDSLQKVLREPAQLEELSRLLDYEQNLLRNDAGELSEVAEALENGQLYYFDELDFESMEPFEIDGIPELDFTEPELDFTEWETPF